MCGICGQISVEPIADSGPVEALQGALTHRGPDGGGVYRDSHLMLAMRRLSVIDPAGGWQPLYNEDRTLVLVANGEIYNYVELRSRLKSLGHRFETGSDCETIVHLYEEHGLDCVQHLRGMFAFALWDERRRRLMLARDRMGEKPLYLYERDGQLAFASELKALLRTGQVPLELDPTSVSHYFHFGYVPEPWTPVCGVRKLPAATVTTVDLEPWRVQSRRYWSMEDAPALRGNPAELVRDCLDEISELIVRSDVPVGVALSGGLDSSAIAALAARKYPGTLHAFGVGYPGRPAYDERADAQAMADHLGLPFHDIELTTEDMVRAFPDLNLNRDDPIADISGYGYYAVAARARDEGVPVILQGQGGDELFWYPWTQQAVRESLARQALVQGGGPAAARYLIPTRPSGCLAADLRRSAGRFHGLRSGRPRHRLDDRATDRLPVFYDLVPHFRLARAETRQYFAADFQRRLTGPTPTDLFTAPRPRPAADIWITKLICDLYLAENGITQGDRLSMASSVELRLPFVDYRLVETVIGLRKTYADYRLEPKAWLKEALTDVVPDWVLRRPKQGFAPPLGTWHRALFKQYGHTLEGGFLEHAGVLTPEAASKLAAGPFPEGSVVPFSFKALVLETWCRVMSESKRDGNQECESIADAAGAVCV